MINMPTGLGSVFVSNHAKDRIEQHSISEQYVHGLIDRIDEWERSGGRITGALKRDGVHWRVVLQTDTRENVNHKWDLVTVVPEKVNKKQAVMSKEFTEVEATNLKLYSTMHE
jgi:hypothetical protein